MTYSKPELRSVGSAVLVVEQQTQSGKGLQLFADIFNYPVVEQPVTAAAYEADE